MNIDTISVSKLKTDIRTAIKKWHRLPTSNVSPLNYLYLFQQALLKTNNIRRANNDVISLALLELELKNSEQAKLLYDHFFEGLQIKKIANKKNISVSTVHRQQNAALENLAYCLHRLENQAKLERLADLEKRCNLPPDINLFGIKEKLTSLLEYITMPKAWWLMSIEGMGGIGKTSLANALVREVTLTSFFTDIAWVTAKQQEFLPAFGLKPTDNPILDIDSLVNSLLEQLNNGQGLLASPQARMTTLTKLLKSSPYLVVIDNLETVLDYHSLIPTLQKLTTPTKFLLTSRHKLQAYSDVFCFPLEGLNQTDSVAFLKYEAETRGIDSLSGASIAQLTDIYDVVGGNPLALKLVVGQLRVLSLARVLDSLKQAQGKKAGALYNFLYWQSWNTLDKDSQDVLSSMPLAQDGDFDQLFAITKVGIDNLNDSLEQLVMLSLVNKSTNLENPTYRIHRLTETFLLKEVLKWQ